MEELGIAKGYIELDLTNMETSVASATKELDKIERSGKLAQSEINKLEAVSKGTGNAFHDAATKAKTLSTNIEQAKSKCNVYKREIEGLNTIISRSKSEQKDLNEKISAAKQKYSEAQEKVKNLSGAYKEAQNEIKAVTKEYGENSTQVQAAIEKNREITDSYEKARDKSEKYRNELFQLENKHDALGVEIEDAGEKVKEFQTDLNNTEVAVSQMSRELEQAQSKATVFGGAMKEAGTKMQTIGDGMNRMGNGLTLGITTPLVAAGTAATKLALDAGDSFAKVSTIADETVLGMDEIKSGVMEISDKTGVAVTEFNEALYQTISATGDTANAIGYTTIAAKAAKGGFTDTATAVDGLTTIMNSYGLSGVDNMQKVSDMMLMTQNYGKTTFGELAGSMGQVIPITSQLGMSIEEVMSIMATLTKNGIGTSEAVTGLKAALSNIIKPTSEASDAAAALGLDFSASALQSKGLTGVMEDVKAALQTAAPEYANLSEKVGQNQARMAELEEQGKKSSEEYKNLKAETKELSGSMDALAQASDSPIGGFATLFGSVEGLNSMMVLTSETGAKDMQGAMSAMQDSAGATESAFEKMNDSDMGKIKKEINKLKNAGIKAGEQLLPLITKGIEFIGDLAEKFSDLSPEQQKTIVYTAGFAAALGPVLKIAGSTTKGIGSLTKGIGGLLEKAGKKAPLKTMSDGVADVAGEAGKATSTMGGFSGVLSKLASPTGVAVLSAAAIVGIGTAFIIARKKAVEANLKEHFGDVKLSAEEVEDVAKRLTTTDWTVKVSAAVEAKEQLESLESDLRSTVQEMDKAAWKISVGLELSQEEREGYKESVLSYVNQVQDYVEQQHYTATLAIDALLEPGTAAYSNLSEFTKEFYNGTSQELKALGDELAQAVDDAWADGIMDDDEFAVIEEKRQKIQEYMEKVSQAEYEASLGRIVASAPKNGSIDAESFQKLQEEIHNQIQERLDEADQAYDTVVAALNMEYPNGGEDYERILADINSQFYAKQGEIHLGAIEAEIDTIQGNYEAAADDAADEFAEGISTTFTDKLEQYPTDIGGFFDALEMDFMKGASDMDGPTKDAVGKLLKNMEPDIQELESIAQKYRDMGEIPPDNIRKGLTDYNKLAAMTGDVDASYKLLADQVADSPELQNTISNAIEAGQQIPKGLAEALENNYGIVFDAGTGVMEQVLTAAKTSYPDIESAMEALGMGVPSNLASGINAMSPEVRDEVLGMLNEMANGIAIQEPQIQSLFNNLGINASDSLIGSLVGQEPSVQAQAVSLLGQLNQADEAMRPGILGKLMELGIAVDDSLGQGMYDNIKFVQGAAKGTIEAVNKSTGEQIGIVTPQFVENLKAMGITGIEGMELVLNESNLNPPTVEDPSDDWKKKAKTGRDEMQNQLSKNPLKAFIQTVAQQFSGTAVRHANGGFVRNEQLSWLAEGNNPEVVIPLSTSKRSRALSLYEQTGAILGMNDASAALRASTFDDFTTSGMFKNELITIQAPSVDTKALAKEIAALLQIKPEVTVEMKDGDVYMDSERVGRKTAPVVSRVLSKKL
ncbi:phage tail tape measure protein [Lacrimispora sp. NSJ-141]|uniref:Phage tail tape measure protein n=1 Tax=Lientehia hominis TaxID=2897778 RepID=A0AAP2W8Y2_9FIRM|nr:phage tail tape measure protein [Lientehia hominis]MCD2492730.1 phage tail tape measure protein [Lientehia hominis]